VHADARHLRRCHHPGAERGQEAPVGAGRPTRRGLRRAGLSLSIRGRASVQIVDGVVKEYLAAARKQIDAEAAAEFEQQVNKVYDQQARIAITPEWVRFWDFGAGRMPQFLRELAERNLS
jgi:hypothetical protein